MAPPQSKSSAPSKGQNLRRTPNLKSAEKIAASQAITIEDLKDEYFRDLFAPNPDDGNNYYLGIVLDVLKQGQEQQNIFNIFEDSVSNLERFYSNYKTSEKLNGIKLLVHIPDLYSTADFTEQDILSRYTKFKINYFGSDPIKKYDILKIIFKNKNSFSDPEIVSIHRSDGNENFKATPNNLQSSTETYKDCRILQLSGSNAQSLDLNNSFLSAPIAGYYQLFSDLEFVFSPSGIKTFIAEQGLKIPLNFESTQITYEIYADDKVKSKVTQNNLKDRIFQDSAATPPFESRQEFEVLIRLKSSSSEYLKRFASFIEKKLSRFKFFVQTGISVPLNNSFYLDILVDIQADVGEDIENFTVDKYIEFSETKRQGPSPTPRADTVQSNQNPQQTVQAKLNPDPCQNTQPVSTELYISIDDKNKWIRSLYDSPFVEYFLNGKNSISLPITYVSESNIINVDDILSPANLKISGEKINKKDKIISYTFDELLKKNSKFYSIPQPILQKNTNIGIKSNFKDPQKTNYISEKSLNLRIQKISNYLKILKNFIVSNEQVNNDDVLILPLNVIRANTGGAPDTESRHYYGQAVDFVVYVRLPDLQNPGKFKIFQIPPIVVYFYCRRISESKQEISISGYGIFIKENYNHYEFAFIPQDEENPKEVRLGLTDDEISNGRLWVVGSGVDEFKNINSLDNGEKHKLLVNYTNVNYAGATSANPVQKILRLL